MKQLINKFKNYDIEKIPKFWLICIFIILLSVFLVNLIFNINNPSIDCSEGYYLSRDVTSGWVNLTYRCFSYETNLDYYKFICNRYTKKCDLI
jgi:preprotein translocase subunit SecF